MNIFNMLRKAKYTYGAYFVFCGDLCLTFEVLYVIITAL